MKKILLGLTLLASLSSFAKVDFAAYRYKVETNSNNSKIKNVFDVIVSEIKTLEDCQLVAKDILDAGEKILSDEEKVRTVKMRDELNERVFRLNDFLITYAMNAPSQCDEINKIMVGFSSEFNNSFN